MKNFHPLHIFQIVIILFSLHLGNHSNAQCPAATLNICTGYNPATSTTVTPSNTQVDPEWTSTVSAAAAAAIVAMPDIIGSYDALPCGSWPAPLAGTTWLMGQNDWGYMTTGTGGFIFTDTFSRPFNVCVTDSINLVITQMVTDDGIMEITLDGAIIQLYSSPSSGISTYPAITYHLGTLLGLHTIGIIIFNYNNGVYKNAVGIDVNANLVSASGTHSLSNGLCGVFSTSSRDTTVCPGTPVTLYADTTGHHLWSNTDTTASIITTTNGTFWVTTTVGSCNYKTDTTHIIYNSTIPLNLGDDTAICFGNSITLDPIVPTGSTLTWSTGVTGPSITVSTTGTYWVSITNGSCISTDTIKLVVNPIPTVNLGPDQSVCADSPVVLQSASSYTSPTYLWSTGSSASAISITASGKYWLQVTEAGCTGADTVSVTIKPLPLVSIGNDTTICPGSTLILGASEPTGATYLWSTGSTDSSISVSNAGTYSLSVDLNGCKATASINIIEGVNDSISLGPDTTLCAGESIQLSVNSNSAIWSNGKQGSSIMVSFPGTYWVYLPEQCSITSDTIKVDFHICDIGFPSAFTPNGDGLNDIIGVVGTLKYYSNFSLSIYNRWGQRVFYTEDIYAGWDGIFNGTKQDLGTYFYMIFYTLEGKKHMMKGDFQLIR